MVPKQRRFASSLRWLVAVTWVGRLGKVEGRTPAYPGVRKETANCHRNGLDGRREGGRTQALR